MKKYLLIDGFNIIHAWPDLKQQLKADPNFAISELAARVRVIHDVEAIDVCIVYDGKGADIQFESPCNQNSFTLIFSPSHLSADTLIERMLLKTKIPERFTIATHDLSIIHRAHSLKALVINASSLQSWIASCQDRQEQMLRYRSPKGALGSVIRVRDKRGPLQGL
jgi:predicted RNA-binding protein with PIN domain